jgi:hypothetical protein
MTFTKLHIGFIVRVAVGGYWWMAEIIKVHKYCMCGSFHVVDLRYANGHIDREFKLQDADENVQDSRHAWAWHVFDVCYSDRDLSCRESIDYEKMLAEDDEWDTCSSGSVATAMR